MLIRLTLSLSLLLATAFYNPAFSQNQPTWRQTLGTQQKQQNFWDGWFKNDQAQVTAENNRKKWNELQLKAECKTTLMNPQLRGSNDPSKTFKNMLGQTNTTSGHMAGYNGNQGYGTNYGTYQDGGQRVTGQYDGMGAMGQDTGAAPVSREMPRY
ncbi:MAG: hypothetical protein K2Y22_11320 [Candidatus Obscuribacterales bacterium]|nr:hypothetical protein [Candidatus Obscuribacterales bacterium]